MIMSKDTNLFLARDLTNDHFYVGIFLLNCIIGFTRISSY